MRERSVPSEVHRIAVAVLTAVLLLPAIGRAEEAPDDAPPVDSRWGPIRILDVSMDVKWVRPLSAITLAVGCVLFVPAALLTAPNGWESITDAYGRFVNEPGEYLITRPIGEF